MDVKHCNGCRNNFYNGNNQYGIKKCWSLESAELEERIPIGKDEPPPYKNKKLVKIPSCYRMEGGHTLYVKPEVLTEEGYWR